MMNNIVNELTKKIGEEYHRITEECFMEFMKKNNFVGSQFITKVSTVSETQDSYFYKDKKIFEIFVEFKNNKVSINVKKYY